MVKKSEKEVFDKEDYEELIVDVFSDYFNLTTLKDIAKSVEEGDIVFEKSLKKAIRRRSGEEKCMNCHKEIDFKDKGTIIINGRLKGEQEMLGFCRKGCLKSWVGSNI